MNNGKYVFLYIYYYLNLVINYVFVSTSFIRNTNLIINNKDALPNLVVRDSWFASIKTTVEMQKRGQEWVGPVKTAHSGYPKQFMNTHFEKAPGGVQLVMEGKHPDGYDLVATGYKYSSKRVLTFVLSPGAGPTTQGIPYEMRYVNE